MSWMHVHLHKSIKHQSFHNEIDGNSRTEKSWKHWKRWLWTFLVFTARVCRHHIHIFFGITCGLLNAEHAGNTKCLLEKEMRNSINLSAIAKQIQNKTTQNDDAEMKWKLHIANSIIIYLFIIEFEWIFGIFCFVLSLSRWSLSNFVQFCPNIADGIEYMHRHRTSYIIQYYWNAEWVLYLRMIGETRNFHSKFHFYCLSFCSLAESVWVRMYRICGSLLVQKYKTKTSVSAAATATTTQSERIHFIQTYNTRKLKKKQP